MNKSNTGSWQEIDYALEAIIMLKKKWKNYFNEASKISPNKQHSFIHSFIDSFHFCALCFIYDIGFLVWQCHIGMNILISLNCEAGKINNFISLPLSHLLHHHHFLLKYRTIRAIPLPDEMHPRHVKIIFKVMLNENFFFFLFLSSRSMYCTQQASGVYKIKCNSLLHTFPTYINTSLILHFGMAMASFFMSVAQNHHPSFMVEINKTFFRIILQALNSHHGCIVENFLLLSCCYCCNLFLLC